MRAEPETISGLADKLVLDEEEVRSILDILVSLGFVRELTEICSDCRGGQCRDCPVRTTGVPPSRTFVLTTKGEGMQL